MYIYKLIYIYIYIYMYIYVYIYIYISKSASPEQKASGLSKEVRRHSHRKPRPLGHDWSP